MRLHGQSIALSAINELGDEFDQDRQYVGASLSAVAQSGYNSGMIPGNGGGSAKRRFVGRAPGRLDLMGGNTNYTGGLAVQTTIAEGAWATVETRDDPEILIFNPQMREVSCEDQ